MELRLRIILERPPSGIEYALQKGQGSAYETEQKQLSNGSDLKFYFTIEVKQAGKRPDFCGPYVQGPAAKRFVYLDIGRYAGQTNISDGWRLKVPLTEITWAQIQSKKRLEARIPGATPKGGPTCATLWLRQVDEAWKWL